jgi:DNA/RNA-binding domain of Phe-tRNA-synthetase-like protein
MNFHLAPELRTRGVNGAYSLLLGLDQTQADPAAINAYVDAAVAQAGDGIRRDAIVSHPVLAGYRALHKAFDVPTRKLYSAPETLFRFVEKRGDIPRILPLVDLYNAVSLETGLALGAHDLRHIEGDVSLRLTTGSERYHPVGATQAEPMRPGEYSYIDDGNEILCRLEVRQVEKTKVTATTTDVFLIVQGNPAVPADRVIAGHDRLVDLLRRFFGGTPLPLHRPA